MKSAPGKTNTTFRTKRCADCSTELPLTAVRCTGCGRRVGPVDQQGRAKKPIDWTAYGICLLAWVAFGLFVWWAFLKD
jgi:hypothetical protein